MRRAIDPRGIDELLWLAKEELPQEEDGKRIAEEGGDDEGLVGVQPAHLAEEDIEGYQRHPVWNHQRTEDQIEDGIAAAPAEAGERVRDKRRAERRADGDRHSNGDGIGEIPQKRKLLEGLGIVAPDELPRPP